MTSREALERFCAAVTAKAEHAAAPPPAPAKLPAARRKQIERAQRELAAAGYTR